MRPLLLVLLLTPIALFADGAEISVCHGFGCRHQDTVMLDTELEEMVTRLFQPTAEDAATERQQIAAAIAYLERHTGKLAGTARDIGGNYDPQRERSQISQMDCIDESRNTSTYLQYLHSLGLLRWHHPVERRYRSRFLIDGHWTAVIEDNHTGAQYAVDSWYHDNGQPPEIQPLQAWLKRQRPPPLQSAKKTP